MSRTRKIIAATAAAIALSIGGLGLSASSATVNVPMTNGWCC